eukprot:CAMPEP_0113401434 /NCGR_PEP_ID=MMETSP0013_2-20120614/16692_1 /TAXON_ID=2843 ORGANISM="Skeletonema costatum, Strain 1716" /NCGR_SAMPLE_ID=MMETSP0013_2 /ASSEMBLY_ACC=CAM_ASM_000158 /LENGTH=531 /DNA_ID=CAMNT_0000286645 /DNA_START=232 /DNA_END=1827 /DNA_ORIENTATION=+ /assembly_acc=CAM_ASM_000158
MSLLATISMMALTTTSSFQPPVSNTHIHRSLDIHKMNNPAASRTSSTELNMVFDFFKKAQTEATEQMSAIATGLAKSRNQLLYNLEDSLALDSKNGMTLMDQLEDTLLQADLGMATTDDVLEEARYLRSESTEIFGRDEIKALLRGKLLEALGASARGSSEYMRVQKRAGKDIAAVAAVAAVSEDEEADNSNSFALKFASEDDPKPLSSKKQLTVHFIMGANGMGKTTTIGKLAHRLKAEAGQKVLLAACDTFRAGAVAQLERWGERADVDCFSPNETTNGPSAVLYGALDKAITEEYDVLLVDTSGRLSNNDALTAELVKMKRVIQKRMSTGFDEKVKPILNLQVPHETLLVIDAAQGRMALDSAKQWDKEIGLSGLILTKLDGSAKGGSVVAVSRELGLPVKLVGVGEGIDDLRDFEPESFVDGLLGIGVAGGGSSKEGKALEARLTQMRKERTQRAKTAPKPSSSPAASPMGGSAGEMTLQGLEDIGSMDMEEGVGEMQMITPGGGAGAGKNKAKNKNKKKKKRKNKK